MSLRSICRCPSRRFTSLPKTARCRGRVKGGRASASSARAEQTLGRSRAPLVITPSTLCNLQKTPRSPASILGLFGVLEEGHDRSIHRTPGSPRPWGLLCAVGCSQPRRGRFGDLARRPSRRIDAGASWRVVSWRRIQPESSVSCICTYDGDLLRIGGRLSVARAYPSYQEKVT